MATMDPKWQEVLRINARTRQRKGPQPAACLFQHIETLEDRLCLGNLVAPPADGEAITENAAAPVVSAELPLQIEGELPAADEGQIRPGDDEIRTDQQTPSASDGATAAGDESQGESTDQPVDEWPDEFATILPSVFVDPNWLDNDEGPAADPYAADATTDATGPEPDIDAHDASDIETSGGNGTSAGAAASVDTGAEDPTDENQSIPFASPSASNLIASSGQAGDAQTTDDNVKAAEEGQDASSADTRQMATAAEPIAVRYDFRDQNGHVNEITPEQQARAVDALESWSLATRRQIEFVQDTEAPLDEIVNIGTGDLAAFGYRSGPDGVLGLGGGVLMESDTGELLITGAVWLDGDETWDTKLDNGDPAGTYDYFTVLAHEVGHVLGHPDVVGESNFGIMQRVYQQEMSLRSILISARQGTYYGTAFTGPADVAQYDVAPMMAGGTQLTAAEVEQLLDRASAATRSEDAIIAVVDRGGNILGVRVEDGVTAPDEETLVFMIDGAVAKARTAAFFANGDPKNVDGFSPNGTLAPLTSRLVRFVSQSTVTQREVESNPNSTDPTVRGPGFVAPIGLGGHFPPEIAHTPPVDLFAIEHTNRDSIVHPGDDGVKGTADDILLRSRFNADLDFIPAGQELDAPESYGFVSGRLSEAQSRGIATLPGGIPLYRDTNDDGVGETLVGGIGVFFPGPDGYATYEQGFVPGVGQSEFGRTNAPKVLEAEYTAFVAAGGSNLAGVPAFKIDGVAPVPGLDMPFGRLDLVGITLEVLGPIAGPDGVEQLMQFGTSLGAGTVNGSSEPLDLGMDGMVGGGDDTLFVDGDTVPDGWLVEPHGSTVDDITAEDVKRIIREGIQAAEQVRAAVRLPLSSRTRMVFSVTDTTGEVLGLYRMQDATVFSIDVATAKARNVAYYADAGDLEPIDRVPGVPAGTAFTNRTFRFLAEPRFPSGVDGSAPPEFSILNDPGINPTTAENIGAPTPASEFTSVLGYDAFNPGTNFRDAGDASVVADASNPPGVDTSKANQNGVVFFPGSVPIYKDGRLIGGLGVSGDGVDQDDVVTFVASRDYRPAALRADQVMVDGVRLPFIKFLRNPYG